MSRITFFIWWQSFLYAAYVAHSAFLFWRLRRRLDRMIEGMDSREAARRAKDEQFIKAARS